MNVNGVNLGGRGETGYVQEYRENLAEARRELDVARLRMRRLYDAGLVFWAVVPRKDLPAYEGWMVKGGREGDADKAFTAWTKAVAEVEHWVHLLAAEQGKDSTAVEAKRPVAIDPDEKARRIVEIQDQLAKRMGERPDEEVPF